MPKPEIINKKKIQRLYVYSPGEKVGVFSKHLGTNEHLIRKLHLGDLAYENQTVRFFH